MKHHSFLCSFSFLNKNMQELFCQFRNTVSTEAESEAVNLYCYTLAITKYMTE